MGLSVTASVIWKVEHDDYTAVEKQAYDEARKELVESSRQFFNTMNHRLARLRNSGVYSPALEAIEKSGGNFHIRGKNLSELTSEYQRATAFKNMQTATVTGAKSNLRSAFNRTVELTGVTDKYVQKKIWEAFNKIKESNGIPQIIVNMHARGERYEQTMMQVLTQVYQKERMVKGENVNFDEIAREVARQIRQQYQTDVEQVKAMLQSGIMPIVKNGE